VFSNFFFLNPVVSTTGQAIDDNTTHAHCMLDN